LTIVTHSVRNKELPVPVYLDGFHKKLLEEGKELIEKKFDFVNIVVGHEGAGKTTFVLLSAYYQDPNITLDNVVFDAEEFVKVVDNCPNESVIIWDEADELSNHWADHIILTLKRKFKRIRKKKLSIWLVTPTIFDLNWYFVTHRTNAIWEVYTEGLERGFWRSYTKEGKHFLYYSGKKYKVMNSKYHNKRGRFVNLPVGFPIDIDAYDDKKEQATQRVSLEKNAPKVRDVIKVSSNMRNYILPKLVDLFNVKGVRVTHSELATLFEVERSVITESLNKLGIYKNNNGFMIKNLRKSDLDLVEGGE